MSLDKMRIVGGKRLLGEVVIGGAKNAALPVMMMPILTKYPCHIRNVPRLQDVETLQRILESLGVRFASTEQEWEIHAPSVSRAEAEYDFVRKMRASVLLLGPLLARNGYARVSLPGGCAIGVRPIDQHLKAFEALGAEIVLRDGYVEAKAKNLTGAHFRFDLITVTGTINALLAAAMAKGESRFENCACEPEVVMVLDALGQMGVSVNGAGTSSIRLEGQRELQGFNVSLIPDRIEVGTYSIASAISQGDVFLRGAVASHIEAVVSKLRETGAIVSKDSSGIRVQGQKPIQPVTIETREFPGFPTDMQAQFMALLCLANGKSHITENIFENRFMHVSELMRMGADLKVKGAEVSIQGVAKLLGAPVMATDLRASASLVLAGLAAEGVTEVSRIYHLDRGYERMDQKLAQVGADIVRIPEGT